MSELAQQRSITTPEFEEFTPDQLAVAEQVAKDVQEEATRIDDIYSGQNRRQLSHAPSTHDMARDSVQRKSPEDLATHDKVERQVGRIATLQVAYRVIDAGGVRDSQDGIYTPGTKKYAFNYDSFKPGVSKGDRETISAYRLDSEDGVARVHKKRPGVPQQWEKDISVHEFAPENQARAKELIQKLADKEGERTAEAVRQRNINEAQKIIDSIPHTVTEEQKAA